MTKKKRRYVTAEEYLRINGRGRARDFIGHGLKRGQKVILCARVSWCTQKRKGNLTDQLADLRKIAERAGAIIVGTYVHVGSGFHGAWLAGIAPKAKRLRATLFFQSQDRIIRNEGFHSQHNPHVLASQNELEDLEFWSQSVPLVTHLNPDADPSEIMSYAKKRGQRIKGRKGGRRRKQSGPGIRAKRRAMCVPLIHALRQRGYGWRTIAKKLTVRTGYEISHTAVKNMAVEA